MDYVLIEQKTGQKIYITKEQKDLLDQIATIMYLSPDVKIYKVNQFKFELKTVRN